MEKEDSVGEENNKQGRVFCRRGCCPAGMIQNAVATRNGTCLKCHGDLAVRKQEHLNYITTIIS